MRHSYHTINNSTVFYGSLSMTERDTIDKHLLRQSFSRAALSYDDAAVLQREVCQRLVEKLDYIKFEPKRILDVGAGTGFATYTLQKLFPRAEIIALDIALPMLTVAKKRNGLWSRISNKIRFINADVELLPVKDNSIDLVFSNLTLQWVNDLDGVFSEFRRVLRDGGMLLFSSFGPDTLKELRASWQAVDQFTHVNNFLDMHDVGDAMLRAHLAEPVMDTEYLTLTYQDVFKLMRDLKDIGAHNINSQRTRGLMGKGRFSKFQQAYEQFRSDGVLPASYEVVYGHAWSATGCSGSDEPGPVIIPFTDINLK